MPRRGYVLRPRKVKRHILTTFQLDTALECRFTFCVINNLAQGRREAATLGLPDARGNPEGVA